MVEFLEDVMDEYLSGILAQTRFSDFTPENCPKIYSFTRKKIFEDMNSHVASSGMKHDLDQF